MYRECDASPFLTERAHNMVLAWLQRTDKKNLVLIIPDPVPPVSEWEWLESNEPVTIEPIETTMIQFYRRVGDDDLFLFVRNDETVYYCPQTRKFLKNV